MANFTFDITAAQNIADEEKIVTENKASKKEASEAANEAINGAKVRQYAEMMGALKDAPKSKGQLSRANRARVEDAMTAVGIDINKGTGKRLYDGGVGLTVPANYKRIFGEDFADIPTQAGAAYFESRIIEAGLDTERKIIEAVFPAQSSDDIDKIVRKVVGGYTYAKDENGERQINNWRAGKLIDQYDEVMTALQNAKRISDAVQEAAVEKGKENIDIAKILEDLDID